jgi:UDP-N-acetylglucosamine:LPS N-acetylglucosamine transferase
VPDDRPHLSGFLTREPFVRVGARHRAEGRDTARSGLKTGVAAAHPEFASFDLSRPTILFLGGSAWTVKTEPVLQAMLADADLRGAANVVVVAGRDRAFETRLSARAGNDVHIFGFVAPEVLAALMGLADVPVLGSLAPATLQELLEVGLGPLLLFHFIPGSERAHVGYIESQRLGVYAPETAEMLRLVREVLGLLPASEQLSRARDGFRERARLLRSRSVERALQLPFFLEQMLKPPPVSRGGARAVG